MVKELFPIAPGPAEDARRSLPLYRDIAWDRERNAPRWQDGAPVFAEGLEAVLTWAVNAVGTARYRWEQFSPDYGCSLAALTGQPYGEDTKLAEAERYVREALMVSPYITGVRVSGTAFSGGRFSMDLKLETIYGEVSFDV